MGAGSAVATVSGAEFGTASKYGAVARCCATVSTRTDASWSSTSKKRSTRSTDPASCETSEELRQAWRKVQRLVLHEQQLRLVRTVEKPKTRGVRQGDHLAPFLVSLGLYETVTEGPTQPEASGMAMYVDDGPSAARIKPRRPSLEAFHPERL